MVISVVMFFCESKRMMTKKTTRRMVSLALAMVAFGLVAPHVVGLFGSSILVH